MQFIRRIDITGTSDAAILFDNLPNGEAYTDLVILLSARLSNDADYFGLSLNGSTSGFTQRYLRAEGTTVDSPTRTDHLFVTTIVKSVFTANTFSTTEIYFPNFASNADKRIMITGSLENSDIQGRNSFISATWSSSSPLTSIQLSAPNFYSQNSSATLYGIKASSDGNVTVS